MSRICVFCGSNFGARPEYRLSAEQMGLELAARRLGLVYGGGNVGLMGVLADAVLAAGGEVIGVIPKRLVEREVAHCGLSDLRVVESMHQRKALMADLSDGFIALPGGLGTLEEFSEAITWVQLGIHSKPCGLLNVCGYYDSLLSMLDHAVDQEFVHALHRETVLSDSRPDVLLDKMTLWRTPDLPKWLEPQEA